MIGGMWSLWALTEVTIFMTAARRVDSMAWRTLARSILLERDIKIKAKAGSRLTTFCSRLGHGDFDGPALPADLLFAAHDIPRLAAALLKELHRDLPTAAPAATTAVTVIVATSRLLFLKLAHQHLGPLVDERLEFVVVDVGQRQVEDVAGAGHDGGEEAVEEDGMEDAWKVRDHLDITR